MCNLYNIRSNQQAIIEAARVMRDGIGNLPPDFDVGKNGYGPIVRTGADGARELVTARWGMPTPPQYLKKPYDYGVTNIRDLSSRHWQRWFGVEHRCLVPATSFSEPGPPPAEGGRVPIVWFGKSGGNPLFFFAGIWTHWHGKRKAREEAGDHEVYGFLTCDPNAIVRPIHPKAMPVVFTEADEIETWMTAPWVVARELQRPLGDRMLVVQP